MLRSAIILATIVATLVATIGFPLRLYSCQAMKAVETSRPSCQGCVCRCGMMEHGGKTTKARSAPVMPCCTAQHVLVKVSSSAVLDHAAATLLPMAILRVLYLVETGDGTLAGRASYWIDHPPPLARQSQSTYLFTSTFLI